MLLRACVRAKEGEKGGKKRGREGDTTIARPTSCRQGRAGQHDSRSPDLLLARQDKAGQGRTRQDKAGQGRATMPGKAQRHRGDAEGGSVGAKRR